VIKSMIHAKPVQNLDEGLELQAHETMSVSIK